MTLFTFYDAVSHLDDFCGRSTLSATSRDSKRAAINAMRELANAHRWKYYEKEGQIQTVASYSTGTVEYDHTGGASERLVTLTTGTWPTWIAQGKVLFNGNGPAYDVATRESSTTITLSVNSNPGADVAAGSTYSAFRDSYPLPLDFVEFTSQVLDAANKYYIPYLTSKQWQGVTTVYNQPAEPFEFTVMPSPNYQGVDAMFFTPPPSLAKTYSFTYRRRPPNIRTLDESTGTVTASSGTATLTGSGTSWSSKHVGSVIRLGDTVNVPTGIEGEYPYELERVITAVADAESCTVDANVDQSYSAVKYMISDPIDIQTGVMQNAFLRLAEKELANFRVQDRKNDYSQIADMALLRAMEADGRAGGAMGNGRAIGADYTTMALEYGRFATGD